MIILHFPLQLQFKYELFHIHFASNTSLDWRRASLTPQGNNNLNFELARDQVLLLVTAGNS